MPNASFAECLVHWKIEFNQSSCGFNVIANCNPCKEYYDIGNQSIFGQAYNLDKQNVILVLNI